MRFEVDRTDFINALDNANKAAAGKQISALGDVHISAQGNKVNITGYDLSTAIFTCTHAKITEEGEVCCSADTVARFLQKCDDVTAEIIVDTKMTVKCGRSKITVAVAPAEDYPKPDKLPPESPAIFIDYDLLSSMLKRTVFAASNDAVKPELRCVNISISNGIIKITAGDGARVAVCTEEAENVGKAVNNSFNIFKENVQTALKIIKASQITVKYNSKNIEFIDEHGTTVQMSVCANEFPNFENIIQKSEKSIKQYVTLKSDELIEALQKISVLPKNMPVPTKIRIGIDTAVISYGSGLADFVDTLDCKLEGDPFVVGVKDKFLLEALGGTAGDITLQFNGPTGAIIFESRNTKHMIMPMRLRDEL